MEMLDWQDMYKVKEPNSAGSGLLHAHQRQRSQPTEKPQATKATGVDAVTKAMSQLLQLNSKTTVTPARATCLYRVAGNTGPGMPRCLFILIWVFSLRYCSAGSLCIEAPAMVCALQSPICLYPAFRQRH